MTTHVADVSPTLWINQETARLRAAGVPVVALGFGEAGLPVLPALVERLAAAATWAPYGPVAGVPALREAAAGYWQRRGIAADPELVLAGPGSKPLLYGLLHAIGGAIALPRPAWVSYAAHAALTGARAVPIAIAPEAGGLPASEALDNGARQAREAGDPLRAVIITLPDNPTGTFADADAVRSLCEVAERHDLLIISDEIYRDLLHDPQARLVSPAEIAPERTVVTSGLSKNLALGGWRIGVVRFPDGPDGRRLCAAVLSLASEIWSAPAQPVQLAAAWAFTEPEEVTARVAASARLHAAVAAAVSAVLSRHEVAHRAPTGGFYVYPDFEAHRERLEASASIRTGADLASALLERHDVACLPGRAFGDDERGLRVRLATSGLYGGTTEQALAALEHPDPAALPWIAGQLERFDAALAALLSP